MPKQFQNLVFRKARSEKKGTIQNLKTINKIFIKYYQTLFTLLV